MNKGTYNMKLTQLLITTFLLTTFSSDLIADSTDPYYAINRSFALGTVPEKRSIGKYSYPVKTYIPRTFLLFMDDRNAPTTKIPKNSEYEYLKVKTQDGVEVWVLEKTISKTTAKEAFKNAEVIFNKSTEICIDQGCDPSIDANTFEIYGSEALKIDDSYNLPGWKKLSWIRNGVSSSGYIRDPELTRLNETGQITFSDRTHPRFNVQKSEDLELYSQCGKVTLSGQQLGNKTLTELDKEIIDSVKIGTVAGNNLTITLTRTVGEAGKILKFRKYSIENNEDDTKFDLYAQIQYSCTDTGGITSLHKMDNVVFFDSAGNHFKLEGFGTNANLKSLLGSPNYLWSINNRTQYFSLLERISPSFRDRALAGYFLAEFNRSCPSEHRTKATLCNSYNYAP